MRKKMLLLTLVVAALAAPAPVVADTGVPPFPVGACAKVTLANPKPICVIIDPTK